MTPSLPSLSLSTSTPRAPLTVTIDCNNLKANFRQIRQFVPSATKVLPIIKADAYGHGAVPVAQTLESLDIFGFGVASVREGILLREHQIKAPIVIMGPLLGEHLPDIVHFDLTPVISSPYIVGQLVDQIPQEKQPFPVHLKIDTGLHRLGLDPTEAITLVTSLTLTGQPIEVQGLLSHFADADNPDPNLTNQQLRQFHMCIQRIQEQGIRIPMCHMANSAGILFHATSYLDMVRPGIMLYGYTPGREQQSSPLKLRPVMQATTYIAHLRSLKQGELVGYNALFYTTRPSQIAVLPVGYTHGLSRNLTGKGHVLIQGHPAPIIGRICMDMMMIDVTDVPHPKIGEEVVLLGKQGQEEITAQDYANWLDTIPYEILCGIGGKANRTYAP